MCPALGKGPKRMSQFSFYTKISQLFLSEFEADARARPQVRTEFRADL